MTRCAYCGSPITDTTITYKGLPYHAMRGMTSDGKLIYVSRDASCFDQSLMGTKSLCGQFAPAIMEKPLTLNEAPLPN